jgi:glycosyltransferase involved in cell wall biosynthesis
VRILHVIPSFWPAVRYGGPIVSVRALCKAVRAQGVEVDVATTDVDGEGRLDVPTDRWTDDEGIRVRYFGRLGRSSYCPSPAMWRFLDRNAGGYDLVHVTGTFSFPALAAERAALRARRPYIVSPRGNLQAWSLAQKRWKKVPYWWLVERPHLARAASIHATAELEAEAVRAVLPGQRVAVVPNGMEHVVVPPAERRDKQVVFLGRLHPKKGLDILVDALALVAARFPGLETVVAGPDDVGEWARIERRLEGLRPRPRVRWIGAVHGEDKYRLLAESTVFVLPSHSENFGQAVVEALACGTPVIVSRNCPWRSLEEEGAGYWVENRPDEIARRLEILLDDRDLRARMGAAGRRLAERYSWPGIGRAMVSHYREVLGMAGARVTA